VSSLIAKKIINGITDCDNIITILVNPGFPAFVAIILQDHCGFTGFPCSQLGQSIGPATACPGAGGGGELYPAAMNAASVIPRIP
jgi:hypothetical protein